MPAIRKQTPPKKEVVRKSAVSRKVASVIDRIEPLQGMEGEGIKINIYGSSGTGKTTFWATFPKPILAVLCSGGNKPGELRSINTPEYRKTIKQVTLNKVEELFEITEYVKHNPKEFKTIVLDHASGLQDLVLAELLEIDTVPEQLSWGLASQQQWGQVALQVKTCLRALLNLSQDVVIIAQQREFTPDEESSVGLSYVASALSPSIVGWLNPACDYICQTMKKQKTIEKTYKVGKKEMKKQVALPGVDYCLRVGPHETFTTKFRMPKGQAVLPEIITDPDYTKLIKLIRSGT